MKHRRVKIIMRNDIGYGPVSHVVGCAMNTSSLDATTSQPHAETNPIVVTADGLRLISQAGTGHEHSDEYTEYGSHQILLEHKTSRN